MKRGLDAMPLFLQVDMLNKNLLLQKSIQAIMKPTQEERSQEIKKCISFAVTYLHLSAL